MISPLLSVEPLNLVVSLKFIGSGVLSAEKGITTERQYSTLLQLSEDGDVEHLAGRGSDKSEATDQSIGLAQKQRFFSLIIHPEQGFSSADIATLNGDDENENLIKEFSATARLNQTVSGAYTLLLQCMWAQISTSF